MRAGSLDDLGELVFFKLAISATKLSLAFTLSEFCFLRGGF